MPYRELPLQRPAPAPAVTESSDDAIGVVLIVIGLVPVIVALVTGAPFGAEPTVGLGLALLGAWSRRRPR